MVCIIGASGWLGAAAQGSRITLEVTNEELPSALRQVERQSGYYKLGYDADHLRAYRVTATVRDATAMEAVQALLSGLPLSVTADGKYIRITPTESSVTTSKSIQAAMGEISGVVYDEESNPLTGVAVRQVGGKAIAVTDIDGRFAIRSDNVKMKLKLSYIGMKDVEVNVSNGKPVKVIMVPDYMEFNEVVVTGYQVIDKRASTSAITSLKAEDILRPDAISIDQMLEGQVPDLMFMSNSGEAAAAPKIRIRGTSSIIGNREPLWVVDGIVVQDPVQISSEELNDPDYVNRIGNAIAGLNPQDIERLDILKDASATALYGTKAANGVIVITTKRGREGKPQIRYNNNFTWKRRPRYSDRSVDVMNSKDRIQLSRELFEDHYEYNPNVSKVAFEDLIYKLYRGEITKAQFDEDLRYYETVNTDWFDLLTHDSFSQSHTVSISGGGERAIYYGSLGFTDNDDVIKNTNNRRYNAMVNLDINFAKWLTASVSVKGNINSRDNSQVNGVQYAYKTSRAIPAFMRDDPSQYYYYKKLGRKHNEGHNYNILNEFNNLTNSQEQNSTTLDLNLRFRPNNWLSANAIFSYTTSNTTRESLTCVKSYEAAELRWSEYGEPADPDMSLMPQGAQLAHNETRQKSWTARMQLDMNKYLNDETHNIAASIGVEANQTLYKGFNKVERGYYPDRGMTFVSGIDLDKYPLYKAWLSKNIPTMTDEKTNMISGYISVSYNYDRLVFLNANARIDGSNNFGDRANDKLLPIWSVSASFDVARLNAIRRLTWIDQFTVKGSFGYQGNMLNTETPVMIIKKGPFSDFYNKYTATIERNPNPNLRWEKTTSYNIGVDLSFLNRRVQLEGDMYWKRTKDAFMSKSISTVNGYHQYIVNGGDIDNYGYSMAVTVRPLQSRDWQWSVSTVFSRSINKIKTNPAGEQYELNDFLNGTAIVKGEAIGTFYSYKFLGLSHEDGGPMFDDWFDHYEDLKGLSKYDTYTAVLKATGSREPIMSGSLSTQLRWKSLRLSANFNYSIGAKTRLFGMYGAGTTSSVYAKAGEIKPENNLSRDYLDRWRKPGDELHTNIPAIIGEASSSYFRYNKHYSNSLSKEGIQPIADSSWDMYDYSDIRVVPADYLSLSSLRLSYELPDRILSPWGCSRLEVSASGNNLFTICDPKLKGQTPTQGGFSEIQLSNRPSFSLGFNFSF